MVQPEGQVTVHGHWASPFVKRVQLALKIKGIPFEYVEENLINKSQFLLESNPLYKKVPVLVHNGKFIIESLIIVEYIDETWPDMGPQLLPRDPFERARIRFWVAYIQKILENTGKLYTLDMETQKEGLAEVQEKLVVLENGMKEEFFPGGTIDISAEKLGILDIMMVSSFGFFKAMEEAIGVKIFDPERNPLMVKWVETVNQLSVVKEITPPQDKFVGFLQYLQKINFRFT
ncbi:OLC1v1012552C1 [Oldenlandia corymbosa var. corymbosa]|uniref:Glutathione S-transferase n=1 Tax=Oldenlandia corymbosa var. corymbosa TaxID=529605 RepID=A0AAV1DWV7_OLDCO|nr:OLC1v1012552C1 [Oldenlandia corymbosa var. corymbosa]